MKKHRFIRAALILGIGVSDGTLARPPADAPSMPAGPAVVSVSGMLRLRGDLIVLELDQPISLRAADGQSVVAGSQSTLEVSGIATTVKDFRPEHVMLKGTLSRGIHGEAIMLTVQGMLKG